MSDERPDDPAPRQRDRFAERIAIATVLATLGGALVGFFQSQAIKDSDAASVRSQRLAVQAVAARASGNETAQLQYSRFQLLESQLRRFSNAEQQYLFGSGNHDAHLLELKRWLTVARATAAQTRAIARATGVRPITLSGPDGPQADPRFPARYMANARRTAYRLTALRDAANAEGSQREAQGIAYAVTLAMFPIAIFLFGFSLTPHGSQRRPLFVGTAVAVVGAATLYAGVVALRAPSRAPDVAADAYADGVVANDRGDYAAAIDAFNRAIKARPDFARAYLYRATAITYAGSPQVLSGGVSLTSPVTLRRAIRDERRARELGVNLIGVPINLGYDLATQGMQRRSDDALRESVSFSEEAESQDPSDPIPSFNRGFALVALGDAPGARSAYRLGARKAIYRDGRHRPYRDRVDAESYVAGALTDLELVNRLTGRRHAGEIAQLKALVVGMVSDLGRPGSASAARIDEVTAYVTDPGWVEWDMTRQHGFDPARDRLSEQWYYENPGGLGWAVLGQVSSLPPVSGTAELFHTPQGIYFSHRSFLGGSASDPQATCLRSGRYKVELYLNGRLAAESTPVTLDAGGLVAMRDRETGLAICAPASWKPDPRVAGFPGLASGWTSPDRSEGAFLFRIDNQFTADTGGGSETLAQSAKTARRALDSFGYLFPSQPGPLDREKSKQFLGLNAEIGQNYAYGLPGAHARNDYGAVSVGAGYDTEDVAVIGAVYGPSSAASSMHADQIFASMSVP